MAAGTHVELARHLGALADAIEAGEVQALADAAAQLGEHLPAEGTAVDAVARLLGVGSRLADDWLAETLSLLRAGDAQAGARRLRVLALAWRM